MALLIAHSTITLPKKSIWSLWTAESFQTKVLATISLSVTCPKKIRQALKFV